MNDLSTLLSLISSVASLVLAVIAIWIALYGKTEADKTNLKTQELLVDIRTDAKTLSQVAMPELKAYGESVRRYIFEGSGVKYSYNEKEIEESVNNSMREIRSEIDELRKFNNLPTLEQRLNNIENQIEKSVKKIKKSVKLPSYISNSGKIIIHARNFEYEFAVSRSQWDEAISRLLSDLNLEKDHYGDWLLIIDRTATAAPKNFVFDSTIPLESILKPEDELFFKTQEYFLERAKRLQESKNQRRIT
ncbi:hypothetical protein DSCO28_70230 [Desulfosarcina ovata subsp. sediminis]|uniref:Uncharacterized protein n=1 Tax=Desulfosarcina ovata subsp. sediminis TaxID=885957 RepID=A0A5K8A1T4_9BACT|nr:hypothetical protein [Desulfosarcina ovata]BBO86457.1 hypothetical protein DSCO28_70230 [Desulfosarcina ovata subsp. sediminis]